MDSPRPSTARRAWRILAAMGAILGATAILIGVLLWSQQNDIVTKALCLSATGYEQSADREQRLAHGGPHRAAHEYSARVLRQLAKDQRALVHCPPSD